MRDPQLVVHGSDRLNLFLRVRRVESESDEVRELRRVLALPADAVRGDTTDDPVEPGVFTGAGIVYTATTHAARETAEMLQACGISAAFLAGGSRLNHEDVATVETIRLAMMRGYAEAAGCRCEYVMNYFGEAYDPNECRRCDNSLTAPAALRTVRTGPVDVGTPVAHRAWGDGIVERVTADSVTVLFDAVAFKTFDLALVRARNLLERRDMVEVATCRASLT